jgi:hypothetical protein
MALCAACVCAWPQSISSGTVDGSVVDPAKAVVPKASVELSNGVSGYRQIVSTGDNGNFRFNNVPFNDYRLTVSAPGFATLTIEIHSTIPQHVSAQLALAGSKQEVDVEANSGLVENEPSAHTDTDSSVFLKLPRFDPGSD